MNWDVVLSHGEDGLWKEVGQVDEVLYFYSLFFSSC